MTHYLFIGLSLEDRQRKLADLKANLFSSKAAEQFDIETLDGFKLSGETLTVALASVPAMAGRKLVVIRNAEKLDKSNGELIMKFLEDKPENPVLVLEAETWDARGEPKKSLRAKLQVVGTPEKPAGNTFNMMDSVLAMRSVEALKALRVLTDRGESSEQILGGMVWYWANRANGRVSAEKYKKGLLIIQEADEAIKHSRYPEREQAVEVAVIKLWLLIKV